MGGAAAVTATAVLGGLAMAGSPAGASGPSGNQPPVTSYSECCSVAGILSFPVTVDFSGQAPGATQPGLPVVLSAVRSHVTVPASLVNLASVFSGFPPSASRLPRPMSTPRTPSRARRTRFRSRSTSLSRSRRTSPQPSSFRARRRQSVRGRPQAAERSTSRRGTWTRASPLTLPITCTPTSEPVLGSTVIH